MVDDDEYSRKIVRHFLLPPSLTGDAETKYGALSDLAFGPDFSSMTPDDLIDDRKAYPGSGKLAVGVQALERAEELMRKGHIESDSIIAKDEYILVFPVFSGHHLHINACARVLAGILPGVSNEIREGDAHQPGVGEGGHFRGDVDFHLSFRLGLPKLAYDRVRD
jgi:hypothetical protein